MGGQPYTEHVHLERLLPPQNSVAYKKLLGVLRQREQRRSDGVQ